MRNIYSEFNLSYRKITYISHDRTFFFSRTVWLCEPNVTTCERAFQCYALKLHRHQLTVSKHLTSYEQYAVTWKIIIHVGKSRGGGIKPYRWKKRTWNEMQWTHLNKNHVNNKNKCTTCEKCAQHSMWRV